MSDQTHHPGPGNGRSGLTIFNATEVALQVSLDPWHEIVDLARGSQLALDSQVPSNGWVGVDLTPTAVFVNAWPGAAADYEIVDDVGRAMMRTLVAPEGAADFEHPPSLARWAANLPHGARKFVLFTEVPLWVDGVELLDRVVAPIGAVRALVATRASDSGSLRIIVVEGGVRVEGSEPLELITDIGEGGR